MEDDVIRHWTAAGEERRRRAAAAVGLEPLYNAAGGNAERATAAVFFGVGMLGYNRLKMTAKTMGAALMPSPADIMAEFANRQAFGRGLNAERGPSIIATINMFLAANTAARALAAATVRGPDRPESEADTAAVFLQLGMSANAEAGAVEEFRRALTSAW